MIKQRNYDISKTNVALIGTSFYPLFSPAIPARRNCNYGLSAFLTQQDLSSNVETHNRELFMFLVWLCVLRAETATAPFISGFCTSNTLFPILLHQEYLLTRV